MTGSAQVATSFVKRASRPASESAARAPFPRKMRGRVAVERAWNASFTASSSVPLGTVR